MPRTKKPRKDGAERRPDGILIVPQADGSHQAKHTTKCDGSHHYRITCDIGQHPETRKRQQITRTFKLLREAKAELARIGHETRTGTYVRPWDGTVNELLDDYLRSATFEREANTAASYRHAFLAVRERLGHKRAQSITRGDIEGLRDWMLTSGRRRGGTPGTGLGARSVRLTLGRLKAAFEQACDDGKLHRNPCRGVKLPTWEKREHATWSEAEVRMFLKVASEDRLHAAWRLSLYGMRRAEVCGLRWDDVDLEARMVTVTTTRVLVDSKVIVKAPKSKRSGRTLPLDDTLVAALKALRKLQAAERLAAGEAYEPSGYVAVDELGAPVGLEWYSDEFGRLAALAGVPKIRLHDGRHSCLSLLEKAGVPISIVSAWAGHYDPSFTYSNYVHAGTPDLSAAAGALARICKID